MSEPGTITRTSVEFGEMYPRVVAFAAAERRSVSNAIVYLCARGFEKVAEERRQSSLPPPQPHINEQA